MNVRKAFLLWFSIVATLCARADDVDRYVLAQMEEQHIPGLSMAVLRQSKPLKSQAYGHVDLERKIVARRNSVFQLQSITKSFTATADDAG